MSERAPQKDCVRGILYVVSTPIGNLEDMTLRALKILKDVDLIAAENVRHTRALCQHFGIETKLTRYNQHNQGVKGREIIRTLNSGLNVALVTNAGTPGISDPGALLISQAARQNIRVSPVPGPSALIAGVSVSGLRTEKFLFLGFLSNKPGKRRKELEDLRSVKYSMVFFEAPHRLQAMLRDIREILGERQIVVLREMTKVYEEISRGAVGAILGELEGKEIKGEVTLVVAARERAAKDHSLDERTQKRVEILLKRKNVSIKDISAQVSQQEGVSYRRVYRACLSMKRAMGRSGEVS